MAATNQQTCYIGFDGHQVAVHSDVPEVLRYLEFNFSQMLVSSLDVVVAQVKVWQKEEKYWLKVNHEVTAKGRTLDQVLSLLKYQVALHLIEARRDLLWLHAGAVAYQNSVVLISGASGQGKSTTVTNLCAKGWTYFSDDIIPLQPDTFEIHPFPQTPMKREHPGRELSPDQLRKLSKVEVVLHPERIGQKAMPVGAVIFPKYAPNVSAELQPCSPATAAIGLIENSLNYVHHKEAAVEYICELVKRIPAFHLSFNKGQFAAELVTQASETGYLFYKQYPMRS